MNMTPVDRKEIAPEFYGSLSPKTGDKDMAKAAANFFSQDHSSVKSSVQNKKRKAMIRLLLEKLDDTGEPIVDINNNSKSYVVKSSTSTILMGNTRE